ncbi:DegT/DnrJ/EryC1/StrS family aminotransferase [Clostridioides sp. ES-S-0145-01]|uniref:DegT/DnrJ/EryC1/StrS family aminotransferase n=1 Tax=Clostridioides sp. ES-S-0145-01 TaxID=2770784 RepID=UPI001D10BBE6|nr:DegT/DnrJ/EryC1/StrS family aminotransferase [Clostridioides sp. ES-S-0145-01]
MSNYPLATTTWDEKEIAAINRVIKSNFYSMGKEVKFFEDEFANFIGSKYAIMVNSGSSANLIAIGALMFSKHNNLKKGDEVIVPAVSWSTTYMPLQQYGLKLKFVDIDINTLNFDLDEVEKAISKDTKAIFAVNLLGNPNDFDRLMDICKKNNLILIEDNCESMGASYKGKYTGTFGIMGTFSTFFSHHITTMEGGVVVTDDEEIRDILLCLRAHGWTRNLSSKSKLYTKNNDDFYEMFNFIIPGYNLRPLEMEAAIGREQLKKLDNIIRERQNNGKYFESKFKHLNGIQIQKSIGNSSYFGFSIIINKPNIERKKILDRLKENNVEVRPIVSGNFTKNKVIKYFDYEIEGKLPNANKLHEYGFFIGNHHYNVKKQLDNIYKIIEECL